MPYFVLVDTGPKLHDKKFGLSARSKRTQTRGNHNSCHQVTMVAPNFYTLPRSTSVHPGTNVLLHHLVSDTSIGYAVPVPKGNDMRKDLSFLLRPGVTETNLLSGTRLYCSIVDMDDASCLPSASTPRTADT